MATRRPIVLVSGVQAEMPRGDVIDTGLNVTLQPNPSGLYFTGDNKLGFDGQGDNIQVIASGVGAVYRTVQDKGRDIVSVKDFGAVGDGVTDDTAAIQAAIESFAPFNQFTTSGGQIYLPPGVYRITSTLDLSGKHGLHLLGSGVQSTELVAVGDFPVITCINTSTTTVNDLQISDLTLRGGGNTQVNAHGIYCVFTNGCSIRNLAIYGCYYGLNLNHSWQFNIENVDMHGGTTDRCHTGVYLGSTTLANIDNAITAYNITVKDCISTGFRIVNGQGSKFVSCEAGGMPTGWHIGEPPSGSVLCQWIHFENCLADSNSTVGWRIAKGSATELSQMQFSNCWSGNSGDDLVLIANANDIVFSNWQLVKAVNHGIRISDSSRIQWNNLQLLRYNTSNTSKQGIYCDNATRCSFSGILTAENSFTDSSFIEVNSSDINLFNLVSSESGTLIGVDSRQITPDLTQGGAAITQTIKSTGDNSATLTFDNNTNTWETGILNNAGGNYYILVYNGTRVLVLSSTGVLFPETNDSGAIGAAGNRFANSYINKYFVAGSSAFWSGGNNSPEGVVTAPVGSLYSRLDGGAGTTLYVKESGTGNTGWAAK